MTPDLIVTGLVLLAGGILLQVRSATSRDRDFLALGAVLGVGYLAKAPVFPVAFVFFVAAIAGRTLNSRQLLRGGMMILSFALVSTPLIVFLSKHKGGLTFGESAKLNLAWQINGVVPKYVFWEGGPPGSGMPIHGPRQIWRSPNVYEFASPIHVTYPPWYDPYYWHEGVRTHLDARGMPRVAAQSLKAYLRLLLEDYVVVSTILLFLASLRGDWTATFRDLLTYWPLIVVAISALGMFAVILVDPRFVAGYLLLLWAPLLLATGAFTASSARLARAAAFTLAIMVLPTLRRGVMVERQLDSQQDNFNTALAVQRSGIYPSDKVAYIGDGIQAGWAKLDRVFFVAEAPSHYWTADGKYRPVGSPFWQSSKTQQAAIYDALRRTGAKAILASPPSTQDIPSGWQKVSGTNLRVMFLR